MNDLLIKKAFYFFNNSLLGRTYAFKPRKIPNSKTNIIYYECSNCGKIIRSYVLGDFENILCHLCARRSREFNLSKERALSIQRSRDSAEEFKDLLNECEKLGTCDILASHHELMKNDNQRLKTSFMMDLICKNNYDNKWEQIKTNLRYKNKEYTK